MDDNNKEYNDIGYIYCLWNRSFKKCYGKNVFKFGLARNPSQRLAGYTTCFVEPCKFICVSDCVKDCKLAENLLFKELKYSRLNDNREFFCCREDLVPKLFSEIVKKVNGDIKFEGPKISFAFEDVGLVDHLREFINKEFEKSSDNHKLSGTKLIEIYNGWCKRHHYKPIQFDKKIIDILKDHIELSIGYNSLKNWWIIGIKPFCIDPLLDEYLQSSFNLVDNKEISIKWKDIVDHFKKWTVNNLTYPNFDNDIDNLWDKLGKLALMCSWPSNITENITSWVTGKDIYKNLNEIPYTEIKNHWNYAENMDIISLSWIMSEEDTIKFFINTQIVPNFEYQTNKELLYSTYKQWCSIHKYPLMITDLFFNNLENNINCTMKSDTIFGFKLSDKNDPSDYVTSFLKDTCIFDNAFSCHLNKIYKTYKDWCDKLSYVPLPKYRYIEILKNRGYNNENKGTVKWIYKLTLKDEISDTIHILKKLLTQEVNRPKTITLLKKKFNEGGITNSRLMKLTYLLLTTNNDKIIQYPNPNNL